MCTVDESSAIADVDARSGRLRCAAEEHYGSYHDLAGQTAMLKKILQGRAMPHSTMPPMSNILIG